MDVEWKCDGCGQAFITDAKHTGAEVECPKCKKPLVVPAGQPTPDAGGAARRSGVSLIGAFYVDAIRDADVEAVKRLLAQGADPTERAFDGRTALNDAASVGNLEMVKLLVEHGAPVNNNCHAGTPLHAAGGEGHKEIVEYLLANGADVNIDSARLNSRSGGGTPLHWAAMRNQVEIVKLLLAHGAIETRREIDGTTPSELTKEPSIKELLEGATADLVEKQHEEAKTSVAKRNEDGTFCDAVPERLGQEAESLSTILDHLPVLSDRRFIMFEEAAQAEGDLFEEVGALDQTVKWIVAKVAEIARQLQDARPQITKIRVACVSGGWMSELLSLSLHRTFSSLPAGFDWMALYGSLTDTKTVIYIGRKSDKQYVARYLTGSNAAAA